MLVAGGLANNFQGASQATEQPEILLAMCDKVGLNETDLQWAMASAAVILNRTGARTEWIRAKSSSPATTFNHDSFENCEIPSNDYILIVLTGEQAKGHPMDLMGLAPRTNVFQRRAYILYPHVRTFAHSHFTGSSLAVDTAILLGSVIAHEVGHLLMPGKEHAAFGLMRRDWSSQEAADALAGRLRFSSDEVLVIRNQLEIWGQTRNSTPTYSRDKKFVSWKSGSVPRSQSDSARRAIPSNCFRCIMK
jgi:hypothetical protein